MRFSLMLSNITSLPIKMVLLYHLLLVIDPDILCLNETLLNEDDTDFHEIKTSKRSYTNSKHIFHNKTLTSGNVSVPTRGSSVFVANHCKTDFKVSDNYEMICCDIDLENEKIRDSYDILR